MKGRIAVIAYQRRLEDTFRRVSQIPRDEIEIQSDFARYLCILVSGFIEVAVAEITTDYCMRCAAPQVSRYAGRQLARPGNMNAERLVQLVNAFDKDWGKELELFLERDYKDSLDALVGLRHRIAHGDSVTVTYLAVVGYFEAVKKVVAFLLKRFE